jgi:hypothetical protein
MANDWRSGDARINTPHYPLPYASISAQGGMEPLKVPLQSIFGMNRIQYQD